MNKMTSLNNLEDIRLTKEFVFLNPYKFIAIFIYVIIALLIGISVFLGFTKKQETIDVQGALRLANKVQNVQVYVDGVIQEIYVQDGDYVEKGQPIFSLQNDKLGLQKQDLETKIAEAKEKQNYLTQLEECINNRTNTFQNNEKEGYYYAQVENYLQQIKTFQATVATGTLNALNDQKRNLEDLLNAMENGGSLSNTHSQSSQLKQYQNQLSSYNSKVDQAQSAVNNETNPVLLEQYTQQLELAKKERDNFVQQQKLAVQQQISTVNTQIDQAKGTVTDTEKKVNAEIEKLTSSSLVEVKNQQTQLQNSIDESNASLASIDSDLNHYTVQATESGYIHYKGEVKKDSALKAGSIVGILTTGGKDAAQNFEVMLSVPSSGIGFVKEGQSIKLTVLGLDRRDYGYIDGKIEKVYHTPIQSENNIYYQVKASVQIREGDTIYRDIFALKDDMIVEANIITKETSWLTYLLEKMNIFKDSEKTSTDTGKE